MATQLKNERTQENVYPVLENNSVDTSTIIDASITTAKIINGAVTSDKLASNSVTTDKITDGAITYAKLGATAKPHLYKYQCRLGITGDNTKVTIFFYTNEILPLSLTFTDIKSKLSEGDFGQTGYYKDAGESIAYVCDNSGTAPQITYNNGSDEANFDVLDTYSLVKQIF